MSCLLCTLNCGGLVLIDVEPLCWPGVVVCGGACKARGGTGPVICWLGLNTQESTK